MAQIVRDTPSFGGGLNLAAKATLRDETVALDALNVTFEDIGSGRQRPGYQRLNASALTNPGASISAYYETGGTKQLLVGCGTRLEALSTAGAVVDSETGLTDAPWQFARFSAPNAEAAYAGNGTDTLRKWDGSTWTAPTATVDGVAAQAMPLGGLLAVDSDSNRLVVSGFSTTTGGPDATASSPSTVYWSEPGNPEVYNTDNTIDLRPGDGERITAIGAFRGQVFIFKETAYWVFYGESTTSTGGIQFDFRPVETGVGCVGPRALAVGPDGLYFMSRDGIYRTTGGNPTLLSDRVSPIWRGDASIHYQGGTLNTAEIDVCSLEWWDSRVYAAFPADASDENNRVLVFDTRLGWWSLYDFPAADFTVFRVSDDEELLFPYSSAGSGNYVARFQGKGTTFARDDLVSDGSGGTATVARWRTGWTDIGHPAKKYMSSWMIWGTGGLTFRVFKDFSNSEVLSEILSLSPPPLFWDASLTWDTDLSWGPTEVVADRYVPGGLNGTYFSFSFTNDTADQNFSIHRLTHNGTGPRFPEATIPETS
jgi:hypothetical protein